MKFCANNQCARRNQCARYKLGERFSAGGDDSIFHRVKRPGAWVGYRNAKECDKCKQYTLLI